MPIVATIRAGQTTSWSGLKEFALTSRQLNGDIGATDIFIFEMWPKYRQSDRPEHLPAEVDRALLQAETNFSLPNCEEAAAIMYRRALEQALAQRGHKSANLKAAIKAAVSAGDMTITIGEWADEIRLIGNDAAHDSDGVTRSELTSLRQFTDAVLRYLYTLPTMVAQARHARLPPGATP